MKRRRRARVGQEKRKSENRRPILKKLCAALLRSFRGQHSEKMKGSARGNWNPREGQQPFRPNPNGVGDRTTTLRRLLIGAEPCTRLRKSFSEPIDSLFLILLHDLLFGAIAFRSEFIAYRSPCVVHLLLLVYPSSSLEWRYGANSNPGSRHQPN